MSAFTGLVQGAAELLARCGPNIMSSTDADDCIRTLQLLKVDLARLVSSYREQEAVESQMAVRLALESRCSAINEMDCPSDDDLSSLRCGCDLYSSMRDAELQSLAGEAGKVIYDAFCDDRSSRNKALRWLLRGLNADKAVAKVRHDNKRFMQNSCVHAE